MQDLVSFPKRYAAVQYINKLFDVLPKRRVDFFCCLARHSPVCSYVLLSEDIYRLVGKRFNISREEDVVFMKKLSEKASVFQDLSV